jgi:hypothetical protein
MTSSPAIVGWGRPTRADGHPACADFHGVIRIDLGGSVVTACHGRWASSATYDYVHGRDAHVDGHRTCGYCARVAEAQRAAEMQRYARGVVVDDLDYHGRFDLGGDG